MKHPLEKSSFKVHILNSKDDSIRHTLVFFWNLPKDVAKSFKSDDLSKEAKLYIKGGIELEEEEGDKEFNIDFENIDESKLQITETEIKEKKLKDINYITDIAIYPEDSLWTLRQKVYLATGIPIYRQHIFYRQQQIHKTGYNVIIQDNEYPISRQKDTRNYMGIMIDINLYANRENIRIRTDETYTILDELITEDFYMYDLNEFLAGIDKNQVLKDNYSFNIIYYCTIKKYFPVMDDSMFKSYLTDETEIISIYPLLNLTKQYLESRFNAENTILTSVYQNAEKWAKEYELATEIIGINIDCNSLGNKLMIRNIIDVIQTTDKYIAVDAYISNGQSKYRIVKHWVGLEQYILDQILNNDEDYFGKDFIILYITDGPDTHNLYIYDDGSYSFIGMFTHTHDINFDNIMERTKEYVQPIIDIINANTQYLFAKLQNYDRQNVEYNKIHTKLKWNQVYSDVQFAEFDKVLSAYYNSGIIEKRNINPRPNTYLTKIVKGMTKSDVRLYLKKGAETQDYYIIFKDFRTNEIWNNRYSGENVEIINTLVNIIFEIHGMNLVKYGRAMNYILSLINNLKHGIHEETKQNKLIAKSSTKKKKFKDIDPALYDFEDEKGTKYARICQKKHRPIDILNQEQYDATTESERKLLFPFINYTTGEPIYYKCSEKLPYFGFIVGKHPAGYCIPKCKESDTDGVRNKQVWNLCTEKRIANKDEVKVKTHNDNILKFGKDVENTKYSYTHDSVYTVTDSDKDEFLMVGYNNYFDAINGGQILDILAAQLEVSPENIIDKIISDLTEQSWNSLLTATIPFAHFIQLLHKFRSNSAENQLNWTDTFVELANIIFGVHIIIFETQVIQHAELLNKSNSSINIKYTDFCKFSISSNTPVNMCLLVRLYANYYPLNLITSESTTKLFNETTKINRKLCKVIKKLESFNISPYEKFKYKELLKIMTVKTKYVWQKKTQYVESDKGVIIGCYNSINFTDGTAENHKMLDLHNIESKIDKVLEIVLQLTNEVPIFVCFNEHLHTISACTDCQIIGCRIGPLFCWFQPTSCDIIRKTYEKFDIELMNYNPTLINNAIVKNLKPETKYLEHINGTYYNVYIYKIFKFEFYKLLLQYRLSQKKLIKKFKTGELSSYLYTHKDDYKYSFYKLTQLLKYSNDLAADLKNMVLIEDVMVLRERILDLSLAKLRNIVSHYVTKVSSIGEFAIENIIYSQLDFSTLLVAENGEFNYTVNASKNDETLFYKNNKLKVLNLDPMLELLMTDIKNEMMFNYEITSFQLMFIINYLNFRNYDDEKIIIQSL